MDKLNQHDKETVLKCIKTHLDTKIERNWSLLRKEDIKPSKNTTNPYQENKRMQKDKKNLEQAIEAYKHLTID